MVRVCLLFVTVLVLLIGSAGAVSAAPIGYATSYDGSTLYEVDLGTSTATPKGSIGFSNVTGLSFQPGTGVLFGVSHASGVLITIDTSTGAGSLVGSLGVSLFDVGLAFDSAGNLYLSGDGSSVPLYSVNPATGSASAIGSGTGTTGIVGLSFDANDVLYGLVDTSGNQLVTIDTGTGLASAVGGLGLTTNTGGIDFAADGTLYGAFGFVNPGLTTIDPLTGLAQTPTDLGITFGGLALAPAVIPEPSTVLLVGLGFLGIAGYARRRVRSRQ